MHSFTAYAIKQVKAVEIVLLVRLGAGLWIGDNSIRKRQWGILFFRAFNYPRKYPKTEWMPKVLSGFTRKVDS